MKQLGRVYKPVGKKPRLKDAFNKRFLSLMEDVKSVCVWRSSYNLREGMVMKDNMGLAITKARFFNTARFLNVVLLFDDKSFSPQVTIALNEQEEIEFVHIASSSKNRLSDIFRPSFNFRKIDRVRYGYNMVDASQLMLIKGMPALISNIDILRTIRHSIKFADNVSVELLSEEWARIFKMAREGNEVRVGEKGELLVAGDENVVFVSDAEEENVNLFGIRFEGESVLGLFIENTLYSITLEHLVDEGVFKPSVLKVEMERMSYVTEGSVVLWHAILKMAEGLVLLVRRYDDGNISLIYPKESILDSLARMLGDLGSDDYRDPLACELYVGRGVLPSDIVVLEEKGVEKVAEDYRITDLQKIKT